HSVAGVCILNQRLVGVCHSADDAGWLHAAGDIVLLLRMAYGVEHCLALFQRRSGTMMIIVVDPLELGLLGPCLKEGFDETVEILCQKVQDRVHVWGRFLDELSQFGLLLVLNDPFADDAHNVCYWTNQPERGCVLGRIACGGSLVTQSLK